MNVTKYLTLLSAMLTDAEGAPVDPVVLQGYLAQATAEYSRWRPLKRTYGVGGLAVKAAIGATSLTTVGGPFSNGSVVTLDAFTQWSEVVTVQSVDLSDPATEPLYVGTPLVLTLTAPTTKVHYPGYPSGGLIANAVGGLTLVAGQSQYAMPLDFLAPEYGSFDLATGQRCAWKQYDTAYNGVYLFSDLISQVDIGQAQNFIGGPYAGYIGTPAQQNGSIALGYNNFPATWSFSGSQDQAVLNVYPAPQTGYTIYFDYYALQLPETIPDSDLDAMISLGQYYGLMANAAVFGARQDLRDIRQDIRNAAAAANLREQAAAAKSAFDVAIRLRPFALSG